MPKPRSKKQSPSQDAPSTSLQIVLLNGPLQGMTIPLEGSPIVVGRDFDVDLQLDDRKASRRHAVLEPDDQGLWTVRDLDSTNLTYLNKQPIRKSVLKEGDTLTIGSTELQVEGARPPLDPGSLELVSVEMDPRSLQKSLRSKEIAGSTKSYQEALYQLGLLANPNLTIEEYLRQAIQVVEEGVPFHRWAWIEWGVGGGGEPRAIGGRNGDLLEPEELDYSRSLVQTAIDHSRGVISGELDGDFEKSLGGRNVEVFTAIAIPLKARNRTISVLYLDRTKGMKPFTREDLEWAAVLASQITIDRENISLYNRLQSAYEELTASQDQLVQSQKMAAIGRLASGFAHDLNNPLASVLGYLELADRAFPSDSENEAGAKVLNYLRQARASADFCRALTKNLLAFARQTPLREAQPTNFNVAEILRSTTDICHFRLKKAGASLSLETPEDLVICGDPSALQQVVMNLVINAADAVGEVASEDRPGQVEVRVTSDASHFKIIVSDNGPGLPEEQTHLIFEPLFTTKKGSKGTGLGLYVVRRIVKESGGTLDFTSETGQGTTFTVELPRMFGIQLTEEVDASTMSSLAAVEDLL